MKSRFCELCNGEASVYCLSDSAFLCSSCDSKVHEANFLVARHFRRTICCKCKEFDGNRISGNKLRLLQPTCRSCCPDENSYHSDSSCSSSTSTCISSSSAKSSISNRQRKAKRACFQVKSSNVDVKAEGVLVNWCRKLEVKSNNKTIALGLQASSVCLGKFTSLPLRAILASSLWLALKLNEEVKESTCRYLRRLEEISGVPAKLILLSEKKINRVLKVNRKSELDLTEGWAECSN